MQQGRIQRPGVPAYLLSNQRIRDRTALTMRHVTTGK
jgi:hypothetical protein